MRDGAAKSNDPWTSHEAGDDVVEAGVTLKHFGEILKAMAADEPRTSAEIARVCTLDRWQVARRLPEMERRDLVQRGPARLCRVCSRQSITWHVK